MFRLSCGLLVVAVLCPPLRAQGTLQRTRLGTHDSAQPPSSSSSSTDSRDSRDSSGSDGWFHDSNSGEALGGLLICAAVVATSPFWVPHALLGDSLEIPSRFPGYPYALPSGGYLFVDDDDRRPWEAQEKSCLDPEYLKPWAVRLALEDGNDFRGLNRVGGQLFVDTSTRLGLETDWHYFWERMGSGHSDETVLGNVNLTFRFAQRSWIEMITGMGVRLLTDRNDTRAGFNFLYGTDLFPIDPVIVSTLFEIGNLDNATVIHARATVGMIYGHWEVLGGYDFFRIGGVNLQGPVLGVRLWF
jgi:hypothetical protein